MESQPLGLTALPAKQTEPTGLGIMLSALRHNSESELAGCEARLESGACRKASASMLLFPPRRMVTKVVEPPRKRYYVGDGVRLRCFILRQSWSVPGKVPKAA